MPSIPIDEIKAKADIRDVWAAIGGPDLRGNRGQAFWRDGNGYSVSLDFAKGLWHDHRDGVGGDVFALVEKVQGCSFREACEWLAQHTGISLSGQHPATVDHDWKGDLEKAVYWGFTAEMLAEEVLAASRYCDPCRRDLTLLLATLRRGSDAALVGTFREWRSRHPTLTAAMVHAGRRSDARVQKRAALWLRSYLDGKQTA